MAALGKKKQHTRTTYRDAGVDIRLADDFIKSIGPIADATISQRPGPMEGLGGFGALFDLNPYALQARSDIRPGSNVFPAASWGRQWAKCDADQSGPGH